MSFGNIELRAVRARPRPGRTLGVQARLPWYGTRAFLHDISGRLLFENRVVADTLWIAEPSWAGEALLEPERTYDSIFEFGLSTTAIQFIEDERKGDDVHLLAELKFRWQDIVDVGGNARVGSRVHWESNTVSVADIARSDWIKRLKQMEWREYEIFEVGTLPLSEDEHLEAALTQLRDAAAALKAGDHKGVLVKCRAALESAAKYQSQGDVSSGFDLLMSRAFPGEEAKHGPLSGLLRSFSEFTHTLGRHEQYPALHVSREEAEFCMVTALGLFSMLSRRLASE